jgi:hypothetical protein
MCGAKDSGLYVPPKEVEFKYCTGKFSKCKRYKEVEGHVTSGKADDGDRVTEKGRKRGRP